MSKHSYRTVFALPLERVRLLDEAAHPRAADGEWTDGGASPISSEERNAVHIYTEGGAFNKLLRAGGFERVKDDGFAQEVVALDRAIASSASTVDHTLYRAAPLRVFGPMKPGTVFVDKAFVSTSMSKSAAVALLGSENMPPLYHDILVQIEAPKGTPGFDVNKRLKEDSIYPEQKELILGRNTKFKVLSNNGKTIRVKVL